MEICKKLQAQIECRKIKNHEIYYVASYSHNEKKYGYHKPAKGKARELKRICVEML